MLDPACFVVLRGPTAGQAMTEAGLRRIFRTHRARSGATRVRPHRLRHTFGTELAAAGIDLLALRELMGHASPETTAAYVHQSSGIASGGCELAGCLLKAPARATIADRRKMLLAC
jgi:integrase